MKHKGKGGRSGDGSLSILEPSLRDVVKAVKTKVAGEKNHDLVCQVRSLKKHLFTMVDAMVAEIGKLREETVETRKQMLTQFEVQEKHNKDVYNELHTLKTDTYNIITPRVELVSGQLSGALEANSVLSAHLDKDSNRIAELENQLKQVEGHTTELERNTHDKFSVDEAWKSQAQSIFDRIDEEVKTQVQAYQEITRNQLEKLKLTQQQQQQQLLLQTSSSNSFLGSAIRHDPSMSLPPSSAVSSQVEWRVETIGAEVDLLAENQSRLQTEITEVASFARQCFDLIHLYVQSESLEKGIKAMHTDTVAS